MKSGVYLHYKGGKYLVLGIAAHTETGEIEVVYISLNADLSGPRMRVRPYSMFIDQVNGQPRFKFVGDL